MTQQCYRRLLLASLLLRLLVGAKLCGAQVQPAPEVMGARAVVPPPRPFRATRQSAGEVPWLDGETQPCRESWHLQSAPREWTQSPFPTDLAAEFGGRRQSLRAAEDGSIWLTSLLTGESPSAALAGLAPVRTALASLDRTLSIKTAPLNATDIPLPINLAAALRLADARPLIVAAAQASAWVAEAQLTRAKMLWAPMIVFGADYIRHDGGGPDFNKGIMTAPSVNYFYAGGALDQNVSVSEAIFQPLAARQVLNARQWDIQTAKNDVLMMTADAYFRVHQYRGSYTGALYCVQRGHDLVERINSLSRELVSQVEVERARNMLAELQQQSTSAREYWRVASADLTQVLRLDPRTVVFPLEHDHLQVTLIDPALTLNEMMPIAIRNRPELESYRALVKAAEIRIRQEKMRPVLPIVMLNGFQSAQMMIQAGIFGLGPNSSLNQWAGRVDTSFQLIWQFDAFGVGNLARIKESRGQESKSIIDLYRAQDHVVAEVTEAQARLQSATARVKQAERSLRTGYIAFEGNFEGLQQTTRLGDVLVLVYRPQEAVYALELLKLAFDEYFTTVAEYNRAQFMLFHALGYPAFEIANMRPPGDVLDVNTERPAYLPHVGNGPPPATR
jgi:outer membrane protein TolC